MPAPNADFILSMLNPYKGFSTAESAKMGIAAGQAVTDARERRLGREQQGELARADDARSGQYLDLQREQFQAGQDSDVRNKQIQAYTRFQAAVDSGDTEQAETALGELQILGVGVERYGGGPGSPEPPAAAPKPSPPSPLGPMAQESPTAGIAQAQAQARSAAGRMSPKDTQTSKELDQLAASAVVDSGVPRDPFMALPGMAIPRPGPARVTPAAPPAPPPEAPSEVPAPEEPQATGPRPAPARGQFLEGDEPAPVGEAAPTQPLIQGYRLKFGDRVIDVDPKGIAERQRNRVAGVFQPLIESAATPEERRAAVQAKYAAMESVGTLTPQQAVEMGLGFYRDTLDRAAKGERAKTVAGKGSGSPPGGYAGVDTSKAGQKRVLDNGRYARGVINAESTRYNVKGIREELAQAKDALSKANSPDGLGQFASKATLQKMLMKGSLSDRDVARLESATGMYSRMQQWVNNWSGDGQVPKDVLNAIKRIVVEKNKILRERELEAAQGIENTLRNDEVLKHNATPEEREGWARTGRESVLGPTKPTRRARGSLEEGGPQESKEKKKKPGGANAAARRLLGKD